MGLSEIGLAPDRLSNSIWTTDQAGNYGTAFRTYRRFGCFAHILNTVLKHTFKDQFLQSEAPAMEACIQAVKNAVRYLKKSGLAARLENAVHPFFAVRFSSLWRTFKSTHGQLQQVQKLLKDSGECRVFR